MDSMIRWSPKAAQQLEDICRYIAKDSERYASVFAQRVLALVKTIPSHPRRGRMVPEYERDDLRELIMGNHRIVYRLKDHDIEIVVIVHGGRIFLGKG